MNGRQDRFGDGEYKFANGSQKAQFGLIDVDFFNALLFSHQKQFAQTRWQTGHID